MSFLLFMAFIKVLKSYLNYLLLGQQAFLKLGVYCLEIIAITEAKPKGTTVTGLEPAIPRSEVWCLIH